MSQIRYFVALCEELNFTRAAERCNIAQPSLTRAIQALEEELGGPLFHRERGNTHLSELGRTVKPYLESIYSGAEMAKKRAEHFSRLKMTSLRLGFISTLAVPRLVKLVKSIEANHPGLMLQIMDTTAADVRNALLMGDIEAAIYGMPMTPPDERLHYVPLFKEQLMVIVSPQHKFAAAESVAVKDLDGERFFGRLKCDFYTPAFRVFQDRRIAFHTMHESDRDELILAMVAAEMGIGLMPEMSVRHPGVVAKPLVMPEFWREVAIVTVHGRPHSPGVGAFIAEARKIQWTSHVAAGSSIPPC